MECKIPKRLWITAGIAVFWGLALGCLASFAMPVFESAFAEFSNDLPKLTMAVFKYGLGLWGLFVLALLMIFFMVKTKPFSKEAERRFSSAFNVLIWVELIASVISIYAMYRPAFQCSCIQM